VPSSESLGGGQGGIWNAGESLIVGVGGGGDCPISEKEDRGLSITASHIEGRGLVVPSRISWEGLSSGVSGMVASLTPRKSLFHSFLRLLRREIADARYPTGFFLRRAF